MRSIAVDWSGRKSGERQAIRLAEAIGGVLVRVEGGRTRGEVVDHLIELKREDPELVVGLDFSFSLPGWFVLENGADSAPQLWEMAKTKGEDWLAACEPPFWGLPGRKRPEEDPERPQLRRTDAVTAAHAGLTARSPFQISGAGSVGASTVRGLPHLTRLRAGGFRIWPWDDAEPPLAIEIWTRLAIGSIVKSDPAARSAAASADRRIPAGLKSRAAESEDSWDAAISALWLSEGADDIVGTPRSRSRTDRLEGRTWLGRADSPRTAG